MKCHLQFASIAVTWRIAAPPGATGSHRGVLLWRGFGEWGTRTKASKHDRPFPRARGLCCFRGCYGRVRWLGRDLAQEHTFPVGSGPRNIPGFLFSHSPRISVPHRVQAAFSTPAGLSDAAQILFSTLPPLPAPSPLLHPFPISERSSAVVSRFN